MHREPLAASTPVECISNHLFLRAALFLVRAVQRARQLRMQRASHRNCQPRRWHTMVHMLNSFSWFLVVESRGGRRKLCHASIYSSIEYIREYRR